MTKEKLTYVSPETNLFVVRFEQGILTGSPVNGGINNGNAADWGDLG